MKRKEYKKPTMEIVLLRSTQPLLAASGERDPYEPVGW